MTDPAAFPGSPAIDGYDRYSSILLARVIDVDESRYTVSVVTQQSGRRYTDLPIANPYAHFERGEGFYVLPEVGAPCWVVTEGAGASPFVLGFCNMPKIVTSETKDDPTSIPEQGDEAMPSYAVHRPRRVRGEFGFTSRDGSFLNFRKGGIIELGSSGACQRIFIPLQNHLVDICEDYTQYTAAGSMVFSTDRGAASPGTDAKCIWRVIAKATASDRSTGSPVREGSVLVEAGHLGDNRFRIVVAPVGIDLKDGSYSGAVYKFEVSDTGELVEECSNVTRVCGDLTMNVNGHMVENITGDRYTNLFGRQWYVHLNIMHIVGQLDLMGNIQVGGNLNVAGTTTFAGVPINLPDFVDKYNRHVHVGRPPTEVPGPEYRV